METNGWKKRINKDGKVKIRPLMDGNIAALAILFLVPVKIRPLMDGNMELRNL